MKSPAREIKQRNIDRTVRALTALRQGYHAGMMVRATYQTHRDVQLGRAQRLGIYDEVIAIERRLDHVAQ